MKNNKDKSLVVRSVVKKDNYFRHPEIMADVQEGIRQYQEGKTTKIDKADFDKLLGL